MQFIIAQFLSTTKNSILTYTKMNCTNISVSNDKKNEFNLNLLFYNMNLQHDNRKTRAYEDDILDTSRPM